MHIYLLSFSFPALIQSLGMKEASPCLAQPPHAKQNFSPSPTTTDPTLLTETASDQSVLLTLYQLHL